MQYIKVRYRRSFAKFSTWKFRIQSGVKLVFPKDNFLPQAVHKIERYMVVNDNNGKPCFPFKNSMLKKTYARVSMSSSRQKYFDFSSLLVSINERLIVLGALQQYSELMVSYYETLYAKNEKTREYSKERIEHWTAEATKNRLLFEAFRNLKAKTLKSIYQFVGAESKIVQQIFFDHFISRYKLQTIAKKLNLTKTVVANVINDLIRKYYSYEFWNEI